MPRRYSPLKQSPQLTVVRGITRSTGEKGKKGAKLDKGDRGGLMGILASQSTYPRRCANQLYQPVRRRYIGVLILTRGCIRVIWTKHPCRRMWETAGQWLYAIFSAIIAILYYRGREPKHANRYYNCCTVCPAQWKFGLNIRQNTLCSHFRRRCMRFQTDLIL